MTFLEKQQLKAKLTERMDRFINETAYDPGHGLGWIPENLNELMANAAFSVMESVSSTNEFIEELQRTSGNNNAK